MHLSISYEQEMMQYNELCKVKLWLPLQTKL